MPALAARGNNRVGRVASAAGARARSSDAGDAGHRKGAATKLLPGAAATLWAARIWPDSFVARRRRWTSIDSSSRLALGPNSGCAIPRDYYHGLLAFAVRSVRRWLPAILWTGGLYAQTCLTLSPATANADGTVQFDLALYSPRGTAPAAIQWTFQYDASTISSLTVTDGPALSESMKTTMCDGDTTPHNCLAAGLNKRIIVDGVIATVTVVPAPGAATTAIQLAGLRAVSAEGIEIPAVVCRPVPDAASLAKKR